MLDFCWKQNVQQVEDNVREFMSMSFIFVFPLVEFRMDPFLGTFCWPSFWIYSAQYIDAEGSSLR